MPAQAHDTDIADTGPRSFGRERMCVATRTVRPIAEMIRFVAGPDGVLPDLKRRLPGRGVWVTGRRGVVAEAVKRGAFKRGLRSEVKVPADLADLTERLLVRSALDALSIAHKAGAIVTGFAKIERAVSAEGVLALIHGAGAGADGVRKLNAAGRRGAAVAAGILQIRGFTTDELDLALGRPNVVHAALLAGRASETFLARWHDLERFRTGDPDHPGLRDDDAEQSQLAVRELGSE